MRDPARTLPRALVTGVLAVTASYLGLNAAFLYVLSMDAVALGDALQEVGREEGAFGMNGHEGVAAGGHGFSSFPEPLRQDVG